MNVAKSVFFGLFLVVITQLEARVKKEHLFLNLNYDNLFYFSPEPEIDVLGENLDEALKARRLPKLIRNNSFVTGTVGNINNNISSFSLLLDTSEDLFVKDMSLQIKLFPHLEYTKVLRSFHKELQTILRISRRVNPLPGVAYRLFVRNPALPLLDVNTYYGIQNDLGTIPAFEDRRLRELKFTRNSFGLGFVMFN